MAPPSGSSKFVSVNLNKSYGQPPPPSNASASLSRSRSYGSSHGGMVTLSRPSRVSSSSSSVSSPSPRLSKLSVPRPVNLPSLRREHAGNDPTVALVSSAGSSGWTKQVSEENQDSVTGRSDATNHESTWNGGPLFQGKGGSATTAASQNAGRPSTVTFAPVPVQKAVVFRGEDFPTLQAAVVPPPPISQSRQKDSQSKQQDKLDLAHDQRNKIGEEEEEAKDSSARRIESREGSQLQRTQPPGKGTHQDNAEGGGWNSRGPSPLIRISHTSNWADDERETLPSFQPQDRSHFEQGNGYSSPDIWTADNSGNLNFKQPTSRAGNFVRSDGGPAFDSRNGHNKDGNNFDIYYRGTFDHALGDARRNEVLKRGWSFSAVESTHIRDTRVWSLERDSNARIYSKGGNMNRPDVGIPEPVGRVAGQKQEFRSGKEAFTKQGPSGHILQTERTGRGSGILHAIPDNPMLRLSSSGNRKQEQVTFDYAREKRTSTLHGPGRYEDPFLGDITGNRMGPFSSLVGSDVKALRMKKKTFNDESMKDPAREYFEAELERVQKMLELERQRVAEEQERAMELARQEQEEREKIMREEEELRLKLEEEAKQAALRAQEEAEEATRKADELRRARDEEKRLFALEEERRKEAARKKLVELEERIARRQEESLQQEKNHTATVENGDPNQLRNNEIDPESQRKSLPALNKVHNDAIMPVKGGETSPLPSLLKSPSLSSHVKEEHDTATHRNQYTQGWKRENIDSGQGLCSIQQSSSRNTYSRNDILNPDHEEQRNSRNFNRNKKSLAYTNDRLPSSHHHDKDMGNWWRRDDANKMDFSEGNYAHGTDATEYLPFGRLRQSLPKQPRVLPPPPGPAMLQKSYGKSNDGQPNETKYIVSAYGMAPSEAECKSSKDTSSVTDNDVSHDRNEKEMLFESVPSEEVVLSDAVSQFSDDTVEDEPELAIETSQGQVYHSDVSDSYVDEADEISDLTDDQESSEETEALTRLPTSNKDEPTKSRIEGAVGAGSHSLDEIGTEKTVDKSDGPISEDNKQHYSCGLDDTEIEEGGKDEQSAVDESWKSSRAKEEDLTGPIFMDQQLGLKDTAAEKVAQDQIMQPLAHCIPCLPITANDTLQMGHSEVLGSRQSLMQQFQQPFSFMAVPVPQPSGLNNANQPIMLSSAQSHQNQQELPFLQLGLLSGVPLMPNAIQIGSIQMPLHIHSQIPQFAQLHGQQQPIFQFGQIGHSGPLSQPSMLQPPLQIHSTVGQGILSHHHQSQSSDNLNLSFANLEQPLRSEVNAASHSGSNPSINEKVESVNTIQTSGSIVQDHTSKLSSKSHSLEENITVNQSSRSALNADLHGSKPGNENLTDLNTVPNRQSRSRRRNNGPRYRGILGSGKGRFHAVKNHDSQVIESFPGNGSKRMGQGKIYRRGSHRIEYKVRAPLLSKDRESNALDLSESPVISISRKDESGKAEKNKYMNHETGRQSRNITVANNVSDVRSKQATLKIEKSSAPNSHADNKGTSKKYETETADDASLRLGVVCVFEQPGIETQNDKDDFIKVRSKRQLLKEQREQREKENKAKSMNSGVPRAQRSNLKTRVHAAPGTVNLNKNISKKRSRQVTETPGVENKPRDFHSAVGTKAKNKSYDLPKKGSSTTSKFEEATTVVNMEGGGSCDSQNNDQSMAIAWGGHRSNQEVVSFTQIQLEEALKPLRLDRTFPDNAHLSERPPEVQDKGITFSTASVPERVAVPGPVSSLLAGEKIQFGAVISPPISTNTSPSSPLLSVKTGSLLELRSETSHGSNHVSHFLKSDAESAYSVKEKCGGNHDTFRGKVLDLEAEAEAAASAVAAAAISNEDIIERHSDSRVSVIVSNETSSRLHMEEAAGMTISRPATIQGPDSGSIENSISVSLPADLLVDMPQTLFQGSPINQTASSGVMLQSLPGGASPFPCLEMGHMLGGPIFAFGPREDASFAAGDQSLSGWQPRHLDSFYGASPFMNSTGVPGIHPHMLVYANPFTPVGQFGQLGMGFMGASYHPSKQPDWTHVSLAPSSSGAIASVNDGQRNTSLKGMMTSRHTNVVSNHNLVQQNAIPATATLSVSASNGFEAGISAPFQMDRLMQCHWSKAPAPPVSNLAVSGLGQIASGGSTINVTGHPHLSRVVSNQSAHIPQLMDVSRNFSDLPVLNPIAGNSFTPSETARFPDELGLGDSISSENNQLNETGTGTIGYSDGGIHVDVSTSVIGVSKLQPIHRVSWVPNDGKNTNVPNTSSQCTGADFQKQQTDNHPHMNSPVPTRRDRNSQRRRASVRYSSDRGNVAQSSKVKQIYVAKSASVSMNPGILGDSVRR